MYSHTVDYLDILGADTTRAGTRTAARGTVGGVGKKALGEALETEMAGLGRDQPAKKVSKKPKKEGSQPNKNKATVVDQEGKQLQKDIKACLILLSLVLAGYGISLGSCINTISNTCNKGFIQLWTTQK